MNVTVDQYGGAVYAETEDDADMDHRWWFDVTEDGRLLFAEEVIEDRGGSDGSGIVRHTVPADEQSVPDGVEDALDDAGYETVLDVDGHQL